MEEIKKRPFSIINVILGVFISLLLIFLVIGFPHDCSEHGGQILCHSNLKQLMVAHLLYQTDSSHNPSANQWCDNLKRFLDEENKPFLCYFDKTGPCSYAMNENIPDGATVLPDDLVIFFESAPGCNQVGRADDVVTDRHGKPGANIAFANGDVKFVNAEDIGKLRWTIENNHTEP